MRKKDMDEEHGTEFESGQRPMIGSMFKFISDWVGGDGRQPPAFRPRRNATERDHGTVIEMQALVEEGTGEVNEKIVYWRKITNIDAFLEQVCNTFELF